MNQESSGQIQGELGSQLADGRFETIPSSTSHLKRMGQAISSQVTGHSIMTTEMWEAFSIGNDSMKQQCKTQGRTGLLTFVAHFTRDCAGMRRGASVADS